MKRSTRILLGVSVALITAASLHFTVGSRFHYRQRGHYGHNDCGSHYQSPKNQPNNVQ
jgi:hypothetical protein